MDTQHQYSAEERREYRETCERNAAQLNERISRLFWDGNLDLTGSILESIGWLKANRRQFWQEVKEINEQFKALSLRKQDREACWDRLQQAISQMKQLESEERGHSEYQASRMLSRLHDCGNPASYGADREDIEKGFEVLQEVLATLKEQHLLRDDRERVWNEYQAMQEKLRRRRDHIQTGNFEHFSFRTSQVRNRAQYEPREALAEHKELQAEASRSYMSRDQRDRLWDQFQHTWETIKQQLDERHAERERKHQEWVGYQEANVERWEESKEKQESFIGRMQDQINDLESQIYSSNNDNFIDRAQGWIREKQDMIYSAQGRVNDLQQKIDDVRSKLADN